MLKLGFYFSFENNYIEIYLGTNYYGCGIIIGSFIIVDVDYSNNSFDSSFFLLYSMDNGHNDFII